ncbi:MAG: rubrerythrin family protein [Endomicrobiales bacterium]|nr:rubrerythrin family protein [Endomicrobiales bacterium]
MKSLKGTKTEKNLLKAFAGESQARNRYTYFAGKAKKEGYEQIAAVFADTADNEKEHAKRFFKFLEGGMVEITAAFPAGIIDTTLQNLKEAAAGENFEHSKLYPEFAAIAKEEDFEDIASAFNSVSVAERGHEQRYLKLAANIEKQEVFKKQKTIKWRCRNCGYMHEGSVPPEQCPACLHPKAFFEPSAENY